MKKHCEQCKYCKKGLTIDYYPETYCSKNIQDKTNCKKYNEKYTIFDYISETILGLIIVLLILMLNLTLR